MSTRQARRTRRGAGAVDAALEAFEIAQRTDEPDDSHAREGDLDPTWTHGRIEAARQAAAADVVSSDEALQWLADTVGRELDLDLDEEPGDEPA